MDLRHNDKDMEKKLGSSVSRRPSDNLDYLPIKKRRPQLRSPSPPLQTPLDGICAPHESVSDLKPLVSNSLVEVQKSLGIENVLVKTNLPHAEDSASDHLAAAACKNNNVDDVDYANVGVDVDKLLTPQGTCASMDIPSLEKTAFVEGENPLQKDSLCGARNGSPDQIDSATVSSDLLDKTENDAEKCSSSAKDVRLNWDLNTVMDEWESHDDDQNIGSTGNVVENISGEGLHGLVSDKLRNSIEFKNSENAWRLLKCKSDINNSPAQVISRSKHLDSGLCSEGSINISTRLSMLARGNFCFSGMQLGRLPSVKNVKLEKQDDVLIDPAVPDKSTCEMVSVKSEEEHVKLYDVPSVGNSLSEFTTLADVDSSSSKSEKAALPNVLGDAIKITPSVSNLGECQTALEDIKREKEMHAPPKVAPLGNLLSDVEMEEPMPESYEQFGPPKIATPSSDVETKELMPKSYEQLGPPKIATVVNISSDVETKELMPKSYEQFGPPKIATLLNPSPDVETSLVYPSSDVKTKELMPKFHEQLGPPTIATIVNPSLGVEAKKLMPKSYEQFGPPKIIPLLNPSPDVETKELTPKSYEQFGPPKIASKVNPRPDVETKELMPKSYEQFGPSKIATLSNPSPDVETKEFTSKSYEQFGPPNIASTVNPLPDVETMELMPKSYEQFSPPKIATMVNYGPDVETKELTPKSYEQFGPPKIATTVNPPPDIETMELMPKSYEQFGPPKIATTVNPRADVETKELTPKSYERFGHPKVATMVNPPPDVETMELMPKSYEQFGPPKIAAPLNPSSDVETKELMPNSYEQFGPPKVAATVNSGPDDEAKELIPKSYEQFGSPKIATTVNRPPDVETKELMPKSYERCGEVATVNPPSDVETKELLPKSYERCGEVTTDDPLGDGDISDLSLGGHDYFVRLEKVTKCQTGCESPFEDGEVRETDAFSWEENECETECLDYDIDDRDAYNFGDGNHFMSEAGSESIQNEDNVNLTEKGTCGSANSLKESSTSASVENVSGQDQMVVEANNSQTDEMVVSDSIRRLECKGSFTEAIRSSSMRSKWSSGVGESPASSALDKMDTLYVQQGRTAPRFQAEQVFRCDKYLGRDRHFPQMRDGRHKNNWNSSSSSFLESRNHLQHNYRRGGILPLPRSTIPNSETNGEGLAYRDQRRSNNHSAKGVYRPLVRRRPLDNSDNACNPHRRNIESGDDRHGMIRGGSGIYHRGGLRGPRGGENHGPTSNETATSSALMPVRRRRSSSPLLNRNPSFSRACRRSRSRSRSGTRSPIPWRLQEERSKGPRMERTRIHYDDSKFEENDNAFCSLPRKRFSSHGNSKFFNDRNGEPSHFRERNLPGRFIGQRLRFDSGGSAERMNSDDGFRSRVHLQRFSKPTDEVWRGHNYDNNNNERTKYSDRNEAIRRVGRNDNSGDVRRFRYNAEDCFDGHNSRNNNGWEGRGHFKYNRERM